MTSETDEPMSVPHFEEALWHLLADAHRSRQTGSGRPRIAPQGPDHRRRGRRMVLIGVSAAAAAATLVVALTLRHGDDDARVTDRAGVSVPADLLERVAAATDEASETMIVHSTMGSSGGMSWEAWIDETTGALRVVTLVDGEVALDTHPTAVPTDQPNTGEAVTVDYCHSQYGLPDVNLVNSPGGPADMIQAGLADGSLVADGTEVVDGRELIRLVSVPRDEPPQVEIEIDGPGTANEQIVMDGAEQTVIWIDPATYRPVKKIDGNGLGPQTYDYLPRTPENLLLLSPPIPEGFTPVDVVHALGLSDCP